MVIGDWGSNVVRYNVLMPREICTWAGAYCSGRPTFGRAARATANGRSKAASRRCAAAPATPAEVYGAPTKAGAAWETEAGARPT